jgi:hypothetical protein
MTNNGDIFSSFLIKSANFYSEAFMKSFQASGEACSLPKKTSNTSKHEIS